MSKTLGRFVSPLAKYWPFSNPYAVLGVPRSWVSSLSQNYYEVYPETEKKFSFPKLFEKYPPVQFQDRQSRVCRGGGFYSYRGGVAIEGGAHLDAKGRLIHDLSEDFVAKTPGKNPQFHFKWKRLKQKTRRISKSVASIDVQCSTNIYHWLYDALPRLGILEAAGIRPDYLYMRAPNAYQKATLEEMGWSSVPIINSLEYPVIQASELIIPTFTLYDGSREFAVPVWALEYLRKKLYLSSSVRSRRIYISRKDAPFRKLKQEDEVIEFLIGLGFEICTLSDMSFEEQRLLFAQAEKIIAPHGAGLANMIYCPPGTQVLEILHRSFSQECYWQLSHTLGLNYSYLLASGVERQNLISEQQDLDLDLTKFKEAVHQLVQSPHFSLEN